MEAVGRSEQKSLAVLGWILLFLAVAAFCVQSVWILASPPRPGWLSDSVDYLILADFFRTFLDASTPSSNVSSNLFGTSRFPPLLPITMAIAGGGTQNWAAGYAVCLAAGLLSVISTFFWLRQQTTRTFTAAALLPLAVLSPEYFLLHLGIYSESQFLLLTTLVLWLATRYERGNSSLLVLALVAGIVPLTRTAGVSLLLALTVWLMFHDQVSARRKRLVAVTVMWLPTLAWHLYRRLLPITEEYVEKLSRVDWNSTLQLENVHRLLADFSVWFNISSSGAGQAFALAVLLLGAIGWFSRFKERRVDAFFLPAYLGMVSLWPYPAETARLLAVSMPVVALCAWESLARALPGSRSGGSPLASPAPALVLFTVSCVAAGPTWLDIVQRATLRVDPELEPARRSPAYFDSKPQAAAPLLAEIITRFEELVKETPAVVPQTDCVWTPFVTATRYYSNFGLRAIQIPEGIADGSDAMKQLTGCRYVIVAAMVSPQLSVSPLYPLTQIQTFARPVLVSYVNHEGRRQIAAALLEIQK